jgi:hypothetical protein
MHGRRFEVKPSARRRAHPHDELLHAMARNRENRAISAAATHGQLRQNGYPLPLWNQSEATASYQIHRSI